MAADMMAKAADWLQMVKDGKVDGKDVTVLSWLLLQILPHRGKDHAFIQSAQINTGVIL